MRRVFSQQFQVMEVYRRHLGLLSGDVRYERDVLRSVLTSLSQSLQDPGTESPVVPKRVKQPTQFNDAVQAADIILELIDNRQAELQDLEESALRTCSQLEGLLGLKQQQASIVEAKAALKRADESVKQGRAIMAFTLVTIFFVSSSHWLRQPGCWSTNTVTAPNGLLYDILRHEQRRNNG